MAWSAPRTWTVGEIITSAMANQEISQNTLWLYDRPSFGVRTAANYACAGAGLTTIMQWGTELWDHGGCYPGGNANRVKTPRAGVWEMSCSFNYAAGTEYTFVQLHLRRVVPSILVYGFSRVPALNDSANDNAYPYITVHVPAAVNDEFELYIYNGGYASLTVSGGFEWTPKWTGFWLCDL